MKPLLKGSGVESAAKHGTGTMSICPAKDDAKELSIEIELMPAPYRDGRCTAFAQLGPGADVIRAITAASQSETIELKKVELLEGKSDIAFAPAKPVAAMK